jgi:hypothetical protein
MFVVYTRPYTPVKVAGSRRNSEVSPGCPIGVRIRSVITIAEVIYIRVMLTHIKTPAHSWSWSGERWRGFGIDRNGRYHAITEREKCGQRITREGGEKEVKRN